MKMKVGNIQILLVFISIFFQHILFSQVQSGKIVYERKTNLEKKFKGFEGDWMAEFLAEHKYKIETFELFFTDSCSLYKPVELDEEDPYSWATNNNTALMNFKTNDLLSIINIGGDQLYVKSTLTKREWKITDSKRMIGKYECRKAIWEVNDSTKIYAWFSTEILPPVGPEGFNGLPGAILGVATEDGGVVYFAKSVELTQVEPEKLTLDLKRKTIISFDEFKTKISETVGDSEMEKRFLANIFNWL